MKHLAHVTGHMIPHMERYFFSSRRRHTISFHVTGVQTCALPVVLLPIGGTYTMDATQAAGLARAIRPQLAVPMHYGFVVGTPQDAERFATEANPVAVQVLTPENPFERR